MVVYDGSRYYVRPAMLGLKGPSHGIIRVSWLAVRGPIHYEWGQHPGCST